MTYTLLDAYLCRNIGDDLMVLELCDIRRDRTFVAPDLKSGSGRTLAQIPNLVASQPGGWLKKALRAESYVMCGGSMFIDRSETSLHDRVRFLRRWSRRIGVALVVRARRGSVEVIGCNIGPVETRWGRVLFGAFLRLATRVTVRDAPSVQHVVTLTGRLPTKAPDMVLSYLSRLPERTLPQTTGTPVIGISVMEWPGLGVDASVEQYLEFLGSLRRDMPDVTVKLFGFQSSIVRDDLLVERIIREGELVEVADCSYQGDAETFLQEYATCSGILATRFHAGVLALGLGIPMVQLA